MNVLVATRLGQGQRASDFMHATEGELVQLPFECDGDDQDGVDDRCGCRRSFSGVASRLATTTATVEDRDLTREQYVALLREGLVSAGLLRAGDPEGEAELDLDASILLSVAAAVRPGHVVEKRGANVQTRVLR